MILPAGHFETFAKNASYMGSSGGLREGWIEKHSNKEEATGGRRPFRAAGPFRGFDASTTLSCRYIDRNEGASHLRIDLPSRSAMDTATPPSQPYSPPHLRLLVTFDAILGLARPPRARRTTKPSLSRGRQEPAARSRAAWPARRFSKEYDEGPPPLPRSILPFPLPPSPVSLLPAAAAPRPQEPIPRRRP